MTLLTYISTSISLSVCTTNIQDNKSDGRAGVLSGAVYLFECNYVGNNVKWTQRNIYSTQVCWQKYLNTTEHHWTPLHLRVKEDKETKNNTFSSQSKLSQVQEISLALNINIPTMQKDPSICHHQHSSFQLTQAWSTTWAAWKTWTYLSGKIFSNYFSDIKENII